MNVLVDVRDVEGVMHTRTFEPDEAAKARAYLSGELAHVDEREQAGILRALASLDRVIDPQHAFDDIYTPASYRAGWTPDP